MKKSEEFINEIKTTLKEEKENALNYSSSISEADDIHKGWIEALEYVINTYNLYNKGK